MRVIGIKIDNKYCLILNEEQALIWTGWTPFLLSLVLRQMSELKDMEKGRIEIEIPERKTDVKS